MKLIDILRGANVQLKDMVGQLEIDKITVFPNEVDKNTLLIILSSKHTPNFQLLQKLPAVVLCDANTKVPDSITCIRVDNPRACLAYAYSNFCEIDYSAIDFIGITGTNGKTTTARFTEKILRDAGYKVALIGTGKIEYEGLVLSDKYYSMTTPDPWILYPAIKELQKMGCKTVVMEVSSHALALDKVAPINFQYGVFTNLSAEHLDFHKTIDGYFSAKKRLFSKSKTAVLNIDDKYAREISRSFVGKRINCGIIWRGDSYATHVESRGFDGVEYMYRANGLIFKVQLQLSGIYNVYNSMLAISLCRDMGVKPCSAKRSLKDISSIPGRFEIIKDDVTVIIDYAHTPLAFESLLKEIGRSVQNKSNITVVFGCGGERDRQKRPKMAAIAEKYANHTIVTSDNSRNEPSEDIIADIISGFSHNNYTVIENREEAIRHAILSSAAGDTVAVVGKGAELYNIDKNGYHPFHERDIIDRALLDRKEAQSNEN